MMRRGYIATLNGGVTVQAGLRLSAVLIVIVLPGGCARRIEQQFPISTSPRSGEPEAPGSNRASPATGSSPRQPALAHPVARHFTERAASPSVARPASVRGADIPLRVSTIHTCRITRQGRDLPAGGE